MSKKTKFRDLNDFRGWRRMGESPSRPFGTLEADGGYVWPWLTAEDPRQVVDDVERLLGLPPPAGGLPASSPTVKAFMMMADLLGLACQGRASLQWRAAVYDSSGGDGLRLRPSFRDLPHLVSRLPSGPLMESGQRFWLLLPGAGAESCGPEKPLIVVDLAGTAWFGPNAAESVSVPDLIHLHGSSLAAAAVLWHRAGCASAPKAASSHTM